MTDTYHARVEELPWVDPAPRNGLLEVFRRRYLLRLLVRREISARYSGSFLGLMWSYINPLSQFLIYFFVIGILIGLHKDVPNFAIHMFCGIILVHYFTETFNAGTRSIMRNKAIVRKMAMPNEMFPVASMLVSLYHVGPQMVILLIACLAYGWMPDPAGMLAVVLALLIIMILGTALALLFSAANVFFRDWASVVHILTNFVRFGVPMIYPYSMVDERFGSLADYYLLNPIAIAVLLFQRAFWVGTTDHPEELAQTDLPDHLFALGFAMIPACLVILVIAQLVFSRLESKIPERI
jgi:ABC-2 type transport system permease protein